MARPPDDDLPGGFDASREVHYAAIRQPTDPTAFITGVRERMTTALAGLDAAPGRGHGRWGGDHDPAWRAADQHPEAHGAARAGNLAAVKDEVIRRWGAP